MLPRWRMPVRSFGACFLRVTRANATRIMDRSMDKDPSVLAADCAATATRERRSEHPQTETEAETTSRSSPWRSVISWIPIRYRARRRLIQEVVDSRNPALLPENWRSIFQVTSPRWELQQSSGEHEALEKLFMDNAANGRNAANDELVLAYLATNSSPYWEAAIWSRHTCSAPG